MDDLLAGTRFETPLSKQYTVVALPYSYREVPVVVQLDIDAINAECTYASARLDQIEASHRKKIEGWQQWLADKKTKCKAMEDAAMAAEQAGQPLKPVAASLSQH